jgi:small conductance mechanosensitive channel
MIDIEGATGMVEELTIVNMQMTTIDGVRVIMPNSKVWGAKITNYSMSKMRRLELSIKVKPDVLKSAVPVLQEALEADPRFVKEPKPAIRVTSFVDSAVLVTLWAWVAPADYTGALNDGSLLLVAALEKAGIAVG